MADPYEKFNIGSRPVHTKKITDPTGTGPCWSEDSTFGVNEKS
jgi:hypothetical protein